jgi:hypothetical protein
MPFFFFYHLCVCCVFFLLESTKFINFFFKWIECENIFTATEARFLPNASVQNWPPNVDSATPHHSHVCTSCYQSRHRQKLISIFPHRTNGAPVESGVTDIGYYIRSKKIDNYTWQVPQLKAVLIFYWLLICIVNFIHTYTAHNLTFIDSRARYKFPLCKG